MVIIALTLCPVLSHTNSVRGALHCALRVLALIKNSHSKTNKRNNYVFHIQFVITPTCFDLSWSSSGSYWTSIKSM